MLQFCNISVINFGYIGCCVKQFRFPPLLTVSFTLIHPDMFAGSYQSGILYVLRRILDIVA